MGNTSDIIAGFARTICAQVLAQVTLTVGYYSVLACLHTRDPLFPFPLTAMETILWSLIEYLTITHYYRTKTNETNELYVND